MTKVFVSALKVGIYIVPFVFLALFISIPKSRPLNIASINYYDKEVLELDYEDCILKVRKVDKKLNGKVDALEINHLFVYKGGYEIEIIYQSISKLHYETLAEYGIKYYKAISEHPVYLSYLDCVFKVGKVNSIEREGKVIKINDGILFEEPIKLSEEVTFIKNFTPKFDKSVMYSIVEYEGSHYNHYKSTMWKGLDFVHSIK